MPNVSCTDKLKSNLSRKCKANLSERALDYTSMAKTRINDDKQQ